MKGHGETLNVGVLSYFPENNATMEHHLGLQKLKLFPIESFTNIRLNANYDPRFKFVSGYGPLYADFDPSSKLFF